MKKTIAKIHHRGLMAVTSQKLNSDFTAYTGDVTCWQGDTELTFTPAQTRTLLPSGNDPAWDTIEGLVTGEVKVKFYALPLDAMPDLLGCHYSAEEGVCVGEADQQTVWSGLTFENLVTTNGVASKNKTIIYKVVYDLPAISVKTIAEGDNAVAEVELTGHAYPVFYQKTGGGIGSRTYDIINSVSNATKYAANAEHIVFPTEPNTNPTPSKPTV